MPQAPLAITFWAPEHHASKRKTTCAAAEQEKAWLRAGKSYLERAIQQLYPLELSCDMEPKREKTQLNPTATEFRPKRGAAMDAKEIIRVIAEEEEL